MTWSIKEWKHLQSGEPADVVDALFACARNGDWVSIQAARKAGMFSPGLEPSARAHRMAATLSILDVAKLDHKERTDITATLQKWVKGAMQEEKDRTLFHIATLSSYSPNAFAAALGAGADPYAPAPLSRQGEECLTAILMRHEADEALGLMKIAYGDEPITHPSQLPDRFSAGPWQSAQVNLLERCARVYRYDFVDWIRERIVPDSPGEEILFNLGDKTLSLLGFRANGEDIFRWHHSAPVATNTDVVQGIGQLAAFPKFRDEAFWQQIACRPLRTVDDEEFSLLAWISTDLTEPEFDNSSAGVLRRARTPRILDAFFEHSAIKVDERIRDDMTLLMHAAAQGESTWVEFLLEKGADHSLKATSGPGEKAWTASQLATNRGYRDCAQLIDAFAAKQAISRAITQSRQPMQNIKL